MPSKVSLGQLIGAEGIIGCLFRLHFSLLSYFLYSVWLTLSIIIEDRGCLSVIFDYIVQIMSNYCQSSV